MNTDFEWLFETRKNISRVVQNLDLYQLTYIPKGLNNNILWNWGHILVTQQLLCHKLAGVDSQLSQDFIDRYRKGSKPEMIVSAQGDLKYIQDNWMTIPLNTIELHENNQLNNYKDYTTSFGVTLKTINEAIRFNNIHEGLHLGIIMSLKKLV